MSSPSFRRCGIVVKRDAQGAATTLAAILQRLDAMQVPLVVDAATASAFGVDRPHIPLAEMPSHVDVMVVVGGDGTLLRASRAVLGAGLPILGVNLGRLGFMVDIAPDAAANALQAILEGAYIEEPRAVLTASRGAQPMGVAINDVVIRHPEPVSMLEFVTYADGRLISHHRADGLIVATPTGSTAYALSAGGPMLHPAVDAVALVPICPHTLSDRPLILPASAKIEICIAGKDGSGAIATLDGHTNHHLATGERVQIARGPQPLRLIHPSDYDWYGILRSKLSWGRDKPQG